MHTYVIPDIHGRYDLLSAALRRIQELDTEGTVVFLGDYIDRGARSKEVIERVMAGPPEGWKWIALRGNHEDMMVEVGDPSHPDHQWWIGNGGETTMTSYGGVVPPEHIEWASKLPRIHTDKHRVYVHAMVEEGVPLTEQTEKTTQWSRYPKGADVGYHDKHVVHGHTPVWTGPELYENRTNLDTGAVFSGKICIGVFDDDIAGGPIRTGFVK